MTNDDEDRSKDNLIVKGKMMHYPHFIGEFEWRVLALFISVSFFSLLISTLY